MQPDTAYRKGEIYKRGRGHRACGRTGLWLLSSRGRIASPDLNDYLAYLLCVLFPADGGDLVERLQDLMRDQGIEADVSCFWHGERGAAPPVLADAVLAAFARLPASIETDFDAD